MEACFFENLAGRLKNFGCFVFIVSSQCILPNETAGARRKRLLDIEQFNARVAAEKRLTRCDEGNGVERVGAAVDRYENSHKASLVLERLGAAKCVSFFFP